MKRLSSEQKNQIADDYNGRMMGGHLLLTKDLRPDVMMKTLLRRLKNKYKN